MYVIEKQVGGEALYRSVDGGWDARPEVAHIFNVPTFAFDAAIQARKDGRVDEWRGARLRSCQVETAVWKPSKDFGFATRSSIVSRDGGNARFFPSRDVPGSEVLDINEAFRIPLAGIKTDVDSLARFAGRLFFVKFQRHTIGV